MGVTLQSVGSDIWMFPDSDDDIMPNQVIIVEATATTLKGVLREDGEEATFSLIGQFTYNLPVLGLGLGTATQNTNGIINQQIITYGSEIETETYSTPKPVKPITTFNETEESLVAKFSGNDTFIGDPVTPFSHYVRGFGGNDRFNMTYGNDDSVKFDGGDGVDTAVILSNREFWRIEARDNLWSPTDLKSGFVVIDERFENTGTYGSFGHHLDLINVERIEFSDTNVALDIDGAGSAGAVYRLYQAALGRTPDQGGLGYWIDALDKGMNLESMSSLFIGSDEFTTTYGLELSNRDFVSLLYNNILGREAEAAGLDYWVGELDKGMGRAEILPGFSESAENQQRVIGEIENGFEYQLWLG